MAPLTVVVLNDYCHVNGGASRIAIDEAVSLAEAGVRVIFFGAVGPICKDLQDAPIEVICLEQKELIEAGKDVHLVLQGLWNREAYNRVRSLLSTLDANRTVVHLHGYTKALTTSTVRAVTEQGFRLVCTLHDFFVACPNGTLFDFQRGAVCPKRGLSPDCIATHCDRRNYAHKLYRVARSFVQKNSGRLPGGVGHYITLSNRSAELLKPYLPGEAKLHPLENLIEVQKGPPVDVARNTELVAVGRLDPEKGIEPLMEAARETGIPLTLVGDGPLRALTAGLPNVRVTGWLSPAKVLEALEKARCLVFPSIWYEAYGLVVAEAAARGVPAIVSDVSAASERVADGVHGWITRTGDVADLARCLRASQDDGMVSRLGLAAYERFWAAPPTRQNHTAGLIEIYEFMLARPPAVPATTN